MKDICYSVLSVRRRGVTLVEMILVVVIMSLMGSYAFAHTSGMTERARHARAMEDVMALTSAVSLAYINNQESWEPQDATGETGSENGLDTIFGGGPGATGEIGKRLSRNPAVIKDPWGEPYRVRVETDGMSAKATVYCVSAEEITGGGSSETGAPGNSGNNGNGNGPGSDSGNHYGNNKGDDHPSNNGKGNNKGDDHPSNNGKGNNKGDDHPSNNGNNGGESGDTGSGNGIRLNKFSDDEPISAAITLR